MQPLETAELPVTRDSIAEAHDRIRAHVRRTPILPARFEAAGHADVFLKLELLQHAGSFKARGLAMAVSMACEPSRALR